MVKEGEMQKTIIGWIILASTLVVTKDASAYYNPQTGRFLNRDPIAETGFYEEHRQIISITGGRYFDRKSDARASRANELSLYEYVRSCPVLGIDPLGLDWKWGNYCGAGSPMPKMPPNPFPVDVIDLACFWHDVCYGAVGAAGLTRPDKHCGVRECNRRLYNSMLDLQINFQEQFDRDQQRIIQEILGAFRGSCNPESSWEAKNCKCRPRTTCSK